MLELLICLAIISIILSIPICKFNMKNYKIDSFAKQLCSDIRYARIRNMNSDYSTYVYYKKKDNKIIAYVLRENGEDKREVKTPENTRIYNSINSIVFSPGGSLTEKGETITILNCTNNEKKEITIVPFSGRVLIKE